MTPDEVRAVAAGMPGVEDGSTAERLGFGFGGKGIAWTFMQRDNPRQKRWPNLDVLAVSCSVEVKDLRIEAAPDTFFDDPHYHGYPAVLVRLPRVEAAEMTDLLQAACEFQASRPQKRKMAK